MPTTRVHTQDLGTNSVATSDIQTAAVTFSKLALAATNPCIEDDGSGNARVKVDGTSIVRGASGIAVGIGDSSLTVLVGGLALFLNTTGGLETVSGLRVKVSGNTLTRSVAGMSVTTAPANGTDVAGGGAVLITGFRQVSSDPTMAQGIGWYNTTSGLYKINPVTSGGNSLPSQLNSTFFSGTSSSSISNTAVLTAFTPTITIPAGYFNLAGRTIRATAIIGGAGVSGTFVLTLQWQGATIWTSPTMTCTSMGNVWVELLITTTATGAAGTLLVLGKIFNGTIPYTAANAATTVDLTLARIMNFAGQFSIANASNAAQLSYWAFELLG